MENPRKFSLRNLIFHGFVKSFLPRKFPAIWYIPPTMGLCLTACSHINPDTTAGLGAVLAIMALAGLQVISSGVTAPYLPSVSLLGRSAYPRLSSTTMTMSSISAAPLLATSALLHSTTAGGYPGPTLLNVLPIAPTHLSPYMPGIYTGEGPPN